MYLTRGEDETRAMHSKLHNNHTYWYNVYSLAKHTAFGIFRNLDPKYDERGKFLRAESRYFRERGREITLPD